MMGERVKVATQWCPDCPDQSLTADPNCKTCGGRGVVPRPDPLADCQAALERERKAREQERQAKVRAEHARDQYKSDLAEVMEENARLRERIEAWLATYELALPKHGAHDLRQALDLSLDPVAGGPAGEDR
jgi:hypothetical protein